MIKQVKIAELINLKLPLVLASKSPRRKLLLEKLGFEFEIIPSHIDEGKNEKIESPFNYVKELSCKKAIAVANELTNESIVIGADTVVVLDNKILNKPKSREEAFTTLITLSNNTHRVLTGVSLVNSKTLQCKSAVATTDVTFRKLSEKEIYAYIDTGSPFDKAGAYGIQDDFGSLFVSHIVGCYYNIVGLPLELFYSTLKDFIIEK